MSSANRDTVSIALPCSCLHSSVSQFHLLKNILHVLYFWKYLLSQFICVTQDLDKNWAGFYSDCVFLKTTLVIVIFCCISLTGKPE